MKLTGEQRVAVAECVEDYIVDWACPDPYDAADFITARILEITRTPSEAVLVDALQSLVARYGYEADNVTPLDWSEWVDARAALASAKRGG